MNKISESELLDIKTTTKEYIKMIYEPIDKFLNDIYIFKEIRPGDLVEPVENIGNLIDIINVISSNSDFEIDTSIILMGISNLQKAIDTNNYLLIVDTLEYEVINSLGMFYDMIDS